MKDKKAKFGQKEPDEFLKKLGTKLATKRKELGYSNGDAFAYEKGINRSQYGKYEAGRQDLRITSLVNTIHLLGFTLKEFFAEDLDP